MSMTFICGTALRASALMTTSKKANHSVLRWKPIRRPGANDEFPMIISDVERPFAPRAKTTSAIETDLSSGKIVPFATDTGYIEPGINYTDESNRYPYPPGKFPPNPLGLYDMSGNISEWVADWYAPDYYARSPRENPQGPQSGKKKVYRGGSVFNSPGGSSTVIRGKAEPALPYASGGFRCAINTGEPLPVKQE